MVPEDAAFAHMSGRYFTIGIENPIASVNGARASIDFTSVLNANTYGARGTYRIHGVHLWDTVDGRLANGKRRRMNATTVAIEQLCSIATVYFLLKDLPIIGFALFLNLMGSFAENKKSCIHPFG